MESSLTSHLLSPPSSATSLTSSSSSKYTNSKPTLTQRFLRPISLYPKTILLLYFILACACLAWPTRNFTPNTDSSFVAPTDSMSGDAEDRYSELYGGEGGIDMVVLLKVRKENVPQGRQRRGGPAHTWMLTAQKLTNYLPSPLPPPPTTTEQEHFLPHNRISPRGHLRLCPYQLFQHPFLFLRSPFHHTGLLHPLKRLLHHRVLAR